MDGITAPTHQAKDACYAIGSATRNLEHRPRGQTDTHEAGDISQEAVLVSGDVVEGDVEEDLAGPSGPSATSCEACAQPACVWVVGAWDDWPRHRLSGIARRRARFACARSRTFRRCAPPPPPSETACR